MAEQAVPCIPFPQPEVIKIPLPYGAELRSIVDMSKPPSDCSVVHSLMLQIMPLLASMECLFKILKVAKELLDVLPSSPADVINPASVVSTLKDVVTKVVPSLADLAGCFLLFDPCEISRMIAAILKMLIGYIGCLIEGVESVLNFQVGIDLDSAQGNPVLLASLNCAQDNAEASLTSLSQALEGIQPLLDIASSLLELVGLPALELPPLDASTPKLSDLAEGEDPLAPVKSLRDGMQTALDALPCK